MTAPALRALACAAMLCPAAAGPVAAQEATVQGTGVVLRALDKMSGKTQDVELPANATARFERIEIDHAECRYPAGNPSGDAFALLRIRDTLRGDQDVFLGWMMASAPALSALDHPRYDVWVLRCTTS